MMARIVAFKHIPLWVQVWGLPFDLISEEASKDIATLVEDWGKWWRLTTRCSHLNKLASLEYESNYL